MPYADVGAALEQSTVVLGGPALDPRGLERADRHQGRPSPPTMRGARSTRARTRIVVSNHGGRQLDGVAPTLRVLPEVVAAVAASVEVLIDGGIRRGSDIVKALCLGARAVLIGRAYAYGLGAGGRRRRRARDRDPARRPRAHAQAARLPVGRANSTRPT